MSGPDNESQLLALLKTLLEQIQQERDWQRQEFADRQLHAQRFYASCLNSLLPYFPSIVEHISAWVSAPQAPAAHAPTAHAPAAHGPAAHTPAAHGPATHGLTDLATDFTNWIEELATDQIQKIRAILSTDQLSKLSDLLSLAHRSSTPAATPTPKAAPSTAAKPKSAPATVRHWFYPSAAIGCGLSINDLAAHELTCLREEVTCPGCLARLQADRAICERCRLGAPHTRHVCGLSGSAPTEQNTPAA